MFYMFQFLINILDRYITIRMSGGSLAAVESVRRVRIEVRTVCTAIISTRSRQQQLYQPGVDNSNYINPV